MCCLKSGDKAKFLNSIRNTKGSGEVSRKMELHLCYQIINNRKTDVWKEAVVGTEDPNAHTMHISKDNALSCLQSALWNYGGTLDHIHCSNFIQIISVCML